MSPAEERAGITAIASEAINSLKSNPGMLTIVLLNVIIVGTMFWFSAAAVERRDKHIMVLIERCTPLSRQ